MKYYYNNEFEEINTLEKAYVLGLFYSDGFVSYNPEKYSYFAGISLHRNDAKLLKNIQAKFSFFVIQEEKFKINLRCNKRLFCEHLLKHGMYTNKSSINKNSLKFPNISEKLYSSFIRGYFDGDGSIYFSRTNSANSKGFSIISSNYFLLKKIKEIFFYEGIDLKLYYTKGGVSTIRGTIVNFKLLVFNIRTQNNNTILKIANYLYKDNTFYMERKIWKFYYTLYPLKLHIKCPRCGSYNTNAETKRLVCYNCKRISRYNTIYYDSLRPKICKYCGGTKLVQNGKTFSKTNGKLISVLFLCRNCNKNTSIKLTAPLYRNV